MTGSDEHFERLLSWDCPCREKRSKGRVVASQALNEDCLESSFMQVWRETWSRLRYADLDYVSDGSGDSDVSIDSDGNVDSSVSVDRNVAITVQHAPAWLATAQQSTATPWTSPTTDANHHHVTRGVRSSR